MLTKPFTIINKDEFNLDVDIFLKECNNELIHYSNQWASFIKSLHPKIFIDNIVSQQAGSIFGLMRVGYIEDVNLGRVVNSLPFYGSHGGPIIHPEYDFLQPQMLKVFSEYCYDVAAISSTLIETPGTPLNTAFLESLGFNCVDDRIGQITLLPKMTNSESIKDQLFSKFHSKTRNMIRKGLKMPVLIENTNEEEDWLWLHQVHDKSIKALGGRSKSYESFKILRNTMGDSAQLYIARLPQSNLKVAGLLVLKYNHTIEYFTPVIEQEYRDTQVLSALIFRLMCQFVENGFRYWNWGGTWRSQEGVYRFKSRWGAQDLPYRYFNRLKDDSLKEISRKKLEETFPYFYTYRY